MTWKRLRGAGLLAVGVVLALAVWGCGSSAPGEAGGTPAQVGRGGATGFLFRAADGTLMIGRTAAPPPSFSAAAGVTVEVQGQGSVQTSASGQFRFTNLSTGLATLKAGTLTVPITVLGNVEVTLGDPPTSRAAAIQAVRDALNALVPPGTAVDIFAPMQPLPPNVAIRPALRDGEPLHRTTSEQWFVYVDLQPGVRFEHPVLYFLVDAITGAVTRIDAASWPALNDLSYYNTDGPPPSVPDVVQAAARTARADHQPPVDFGTPNPPLPEPHGRADDPGKTYLMTVQGDRGLDFGADPPRIPGLLAKMGLPPIAAVDHVKSWQLNAPRGAGEAALSARFDALAAKTKSGDTLVFYLTTHGQTRDYEVGDTGTTKAYNFTMELSNTPPGKEESWGRSYRTEYISPLSLNFSRAKACRIVIIADTCYSGYWVTLQSARLQALSGKEVVVMTAANTSETATGLTKPETVTVGGAPITLAKGGAFTSALVHTFNGNVPGDQLYARFQSGFTQSVQIADAVNARFGLRSQQPQFWTRQLSPDESCESGSQIVIIK